MSTPVPVNETNKRLIEDAVTAFCAREYGSETRSTFDNWGRISVLYTTSDFALDEEYLEDLEVQTDIVAMPDGTYAWHAYVDDAYITCEYYEPFYEGEIFPIEDGGYDFDSIYSWMYEHLDKLFLMGLYTKEED